MCAHTPMPRLAQLLIPRMHTHIPTQSLMHAHTGDEITHTNTHGHARSLEFTSTGTHAPRHDAWKMCALACSSRPQCVHARGSCEDVMLHDASRETTLAFVPTLHTCMPEQTLNVCKLPPRVRALDRDMQVLRRLDVRLIKTHAQVHSQGTHNAHAHTDLGACRHKQNEREHKVAHTSSVIRTTASCKRQGALDK